MPSLTSLTGLLAIFLLATHVNGQHGFGPGVHINSHYPHPPHDQPYTTRTYSPPPTTTTTTSSTFGPPTIISVPGVTTIETTVTLGVTAGVEGRGGGRSVPVEGTTLVAVVRRA
ncbi:hypothetical protein B0T20DRAFT_243942 [Sordaria brevicollis]|uniref:Uncharacterized protein n=1 Tax=Sordaria brevicollis TaxID=83679 RepID=A0AAE0PBC3_SORBR|nr:hypothetical protein B0T20DRAFT_243942 [Sordaria brevicollis]